MAVRLQQARVGGAGVDADADGHSDGGGDLGDVGDAVIEFRDVAGVAYGGAARVDGCEDEAGLEVNIGGRKDAELCAISSLASRPGLGKASVRRPRNRHITTTRALHRSTVRGELPGWS